MGEPGLGWVRRPVVWTARRLGYDVWRVPTRAAGRQWRDADYYRPFFSPWLGYGDFVDVLALTDGLTLLPPDRLYGLWTAMRNAPVGEVWECGVYRGGTARLLATMGRTLRLFDTFAGLPDPDPDHDLLRAGAFGDTSVAAVRSVVGEADYRVGLIPDTFIGLEDAHIALAHVDLDLYASVQAACEFIYPRLVPGGLMVFDDYGGQTTPGARAAVDECSARWPEVPWVSPSGQAVVIRGR